MKKEQTLRAREDALEKAKESFDGQLAPKLREERGTIAAEESIKAII